MITWKLYESNAGTLYYVCGDHIVDLGEDFRGNEAVELDLHEGTPVAPNEWHEISDGTGGAKHVADLQGQSPPVIVSRHGQPGTAAQYFLERCPDSERPVCAECAAPAEWAIERLGRDVRAGWRCAEHHGAALETQPKTARNPFVDSDGWVKIEPGVSVRFEDGRPERVAITQRCQLDHDHDAEECDFDEDRTDADYAAAIEEGEVDGEDWDFSSLPLYGGSNVAEETSAAGVWSWDEESVLVGQGELRVIPRAELAQWVAGRGR